MKSDTISFYRHVNNSLNPHRWLISLLAASLFSPFIVALALGGRIDSDRQMLKALTPYIATLVESSDRPEILRVLHSVSESKNADIILVQEGIVFATNKSISDLDMQFIKPNIKLHFYDLEFTKTQIILSSMVNRTGDSSQKNMLYIITPLLVSGLVI